MANLKDAIHEVFNEYSSAIIAGDIDRWISLWTDDGIQMAPNVPANIGKEQIRENNKDIFTLYDWGAFSIKNEEVRETDDWGWGRGTYTFKMTHKETGDIIEGPGKYSTIFEKQDDGSWKIARDCFNWSFG